MAEAEAIAPELINNFDLTLKFNVNSNIALAHNSYKKINLHLAQLHMSGTLPQLISSFQ